MTMFTPYTTATNGTPLHLVTTADYSQWLRQQNKFHQRWLNANNYQGEGLALVPNTDGGLACALFAAESFEHPLCCGDLVNQLPPGDYCPTGDPQALEHLPLSWGLGAYRFNGFRKPKESSPWPRLILSTEAEVVNAEQMRRAVARVRDMINTPASNMMPEDLACQMRELAETFGAELNCIVGDELLEQNYPAIHTVGRASIHAPQLLDLRWGDAQHPKLTLVGKGVCFDSGGLNIKSADGMRHMKKDMGGAANAIGLAELIMARGLPVRLRVLIPAVENAISANAYRPGDVIVTRKGLSVEVENTDAEGRLILADALAEADCESPDLLLNFATLTGACRVALGIDLPGVFTNTEALLPALTAAAQANGDPVWPLPLYAPYRDSLKSHVADIASASQAGDRKMGGAIIAALFLQSFVRDTTPWCHFDIYGANARAQPGRPMGGDAMAIRGVFGYLCKRFS